MFFDGDFGSKRKVNLGGKSKTEQDKKAFLEKQKQEREKRFQEKRQLKAAITIQSFHRGVWALRKARDIERELWDKSISNYAPNMVHSFLRSLLFFYRVGNSGDNNRLRIMCELVLASVASKGIIC